jgi:hypothetical protein
MKASRTKRLERIEKMASSARYHPFCTVGVDSSGDINKAMRFIFWDVFNSGFNYPAGRELYWRQEYSPEVSMPESWTHPGRIDEATFWGELVAGPVKP